MSDQAPLERRYRRLLACYPAAFRREHEDEMLVVLLACARDGRRHPGIADAADLLWHALRLRVAPATRRSVPTVFWGVRLMVLAALLELVALAVVIGSEGAVGAAVLRHAPHPGAAHWATLVHGQVVPVEVGAPVAALVWLVLAWANDRGHRWGRVGAVALSALTSVSLLVALGRHAAAYAVADLTVGIVLSATALAATLLIISTDSNAHYGTRRHGGGTRRVGTNHATAVIWQAGPDTASWN